MILRPKERSSSAIGLIPAWQAVADTQRAPSAHYHLIHQPDHARLAGEIAEQLTIAGALPLDADIVRAISLHDEGWADFDSGRKRLQATTARYSETNVALNGEGKPLSFLDIKAGDFLRAWLDSIESAEAIAPIAGLMVSGHFRRIGQFGMSTGTYSDEDGQLVREFIAREQAREQRLLRLQSRSDKEVEYWTDVLQFCDLLSLYLCCGSEESVEFPQRIGPKGGAIRLQVSDGVNVLSPSPLVQEIECSLEAQSYPPELHASSTKLNWRMR